jgi:hypothetical protein
MSVPLVKIGGLELGLGAGKEVLVERDESWTTRPAVSVF